METDAVVRRVSDTMQQTFRRLTSLATGIGILALLIGGATFATGLWVFDGSRTEWIIIGGVICAIPVLAALIGRHLVRRTAKRAPELVTDVRKFLDTSVHSAQVLIDHDSGEPVAGYVRSFKTLRGELKQRRKELPALFSGVKAITSVPGIAAVAVIGMCLVGGLGTVLLIGGLID
jgi:type VI protein secretion system component VasK